ncbi:hypothetical protein FIBSPDRAFT_509026 [Athelia psychrophila]|uniref:Uncharacterized protein n=1 Tax=Athelia psychrophila TaxID=1759441 RepID=A0A166JXD4_9AGAM|nr:hypothetical protein FIBSPDRAFT_509026 [Fibularhizoctonia sp. CBS 109695]
MQSVTGITSQPKSTLETFPCAELQRYITVQNLHFATWPAGKAAPETLQRVIQAWNSFVAPYTPIEGFQHEYPTSDILYDGVSVLLAAMARLSSVPMPRQKKDPLLPFIAMCPSICIWIQTLFACAQPTCPQHGVWLDLKLETRQMRYDAAFGALEFLTRPTSPTCSAANRMPGVMSTSAALWIAEGRDPSYTFGFQAAWLMRDPPEDSEQNVYYPPDLLKHIADRDLDHDAIINVMILRINGNLLQEQPDISSLGQDLLLLCVQVKADETATELSQNMRLSFLSRSTCAVEIANILSLILDKYTQIQSLFGQLLDPCLNIALILVEDKFAFHRISQLLDSAFFNLLARADGLLGPPAPGLLGPREVIERLVPTFLTRLSMHRSMFTRMRTELLPTRRRYKNQNGQLHTLFANFEAKLSSGKGKSGNTRRVPLPYAAVETLSVGLLIEGTHFAGALVAI